MIFVTGPLFAGKEETVCRLLGWSKQDFSERALRDVQEMAALTEDLYGLADKLAGKEVVVATETGCGVVPADPELRRRREAAGRLSCLLAERADCVIRVYCGIPEIIKGEIPDEEHSVC